MRAEAQHRLAAAMGDTLRQQQLATERLAQRLHAADLVDGGTDDGEVETSRGTNVAVEDVAEMESDGQVESGPALGGAPGVERRVPAAGIDRCPHRLGAGVLGADGRRREHREDAIAEELQDLTVALGDRIADAFEMLIEPADDLRAPSAVDERREASEIGEQQGG